MAATTIMIASAVGTAIVSTAITATVESGLADKAIDKSFAWLDGKIDQFGKATGITPSNYQDITNPQMWANRGAKELSKKI